MNPLGKKQKMMTAIAMAAEGLGLAAELLETIQGRAAAARKNAGRTVNDIRENAADAAQSIADNFDRQVRPRASAGSRVLQFVAGMGVGVGIALLFAPMPGSEARANLYKAVKKAREGEKEKNYGPVSASSEYSKQEKYGS